MCNWKANISYNQCHVIFKAISIKTFGFYIDWAILFDPNLIPLRIKFETLLVMAFIGLYFSVQRLAQWLKMAKLLQQSWFD